jgi:hypothetical protein
MWDARLAAELVSPRRENYRDWFWGGTGGKHVTPHLHWAARILLSILLGRF